MEQLARIGKVAALVGGVAWTVKSLTIIALNDHFQPIEGVLYFLGVGGILIGALGLGAYVARRWTGVQRGLAFAITVVLAALVTSVVSSFIQNAVGDAYRGNNVGLEDEIGILVPGLIWLATGLFLLRATRDVGHAPTATRPVV